MSSEWVILQTQVFLKTFPIVDRMGSEKMQKESFKGGSGKLRVSRKNQDVVNFQEVPGIVYLWIL